MEMAASANQPRLAFGSDDMRKMRVTDRAVLSSCMEFLRRRGFNGEDMTSLLVRHFYVDLDELREVLNAEA